MGPRLINNIVRELHETLHGGVVSKIHQPDERNIIIRIFQRGRDFKLIISAHHNHPRLHLTEESYVNPPAPLRFCAYLRSRLTNARIESVHQVGLERIVRIVFKKSFDGQTEENILVAEVTGKSSNIILIDKEGVVLDSLRYFPVETSVRAVVPGIRLEPLPPGPGAQEELAPKPDGLSWNEATDRYYSVLLKEEFFAAEKSALKRAINEAGKKAKRKLENLLGDHRGAEQGLLAGRLGEVLTANYPKMKKGMKEVEAVDYTKEPPETVVIKLDERLSPNENVQRYFKRAKKAKTAIEMLGSRIPEVEQELEYLENLLFEAEDAEKGDIESIREELVEGGYLKRMEEKAGGLKEALQKAEPIRRSISSEGFEMLCGKSGTGNDLILQKHASNEDIWFHVSNLPGSHVLIKVAGRKNELTKKTIEEAASLAAWHSKAKNASKAEVIYAEARHVKKPRGAKPGLVTVKEYKTIVVRPKEVG